MPRSEEARTVWYLVTLPQGDLDRITEYVTWIRQRLAGSSQTEPKPKRHRRTKAELVADQAKINEKVRSRAVQTSLTQFDEAAPKRHKVRTDPDGNAIAS